MQEAVFHLSYPVLTCIFQQVYISFTSFHLLDTSPLLQTMESRPVVPDRKLLARLVLIREEARNMMGGGILDERNDRGFNTLPQSEVSICLESGMREENFRLIFIGLERSSL